MAAALLPFQSIPHLASCFPVNNGIKLRKPVSALTVTNKIADKSTPPFCRLRLSVSSITSDGDRRRRSRPRESSASGRKSADESEIWSDGDTAPNSATKEEIIALFRRIRSSISNSKGESGSGTSLSSSSKDKSTAESVLDVLRESRKNVRGSRSNKGGKALRWRSGVPKKTQATPDFKLTRPPSNFIKRSPIPYPTAPRGKGLELNNEEVSDEGLKLAELEKMKLPELKEVAKARGIKGYSRLKKGELVQLLTS